jgi:hypothetical protein
MNQLIMAVATGLYVGMIPRAPGTWGSLAALLPWLLIKDLPLLPYLAVLAAVFVLGFFAAGSAEKILDRPDAGAIVIDEILGCSSPDPGPGPSRRLASRLHLLSGSSISPNPFRSPGSISTSWRHRHHDGRCHRRSHA